MKTRTVALILLSIALGCDPRSPESDSTTSMSAASPVEGAWVVSEITNYDDPQPGYLLFVDGHYSLVRVNLEYPRPALEPYDSATVEGLRAVWGPFTAQSGTYEMMDSTITFRPVVAKNPAVMAPGNRIRSRARILGDSLWIMDMPADGAAIPDSSPPVYKYVRARPR